MSSTRRLVTCLPRTTTLHARAAFHASAPAYVNVGDSVPNVEVLHENSPGNKVNLATELVGNGLIIGVPAAFSMFLHIPVKELFCHRSDPTNGIFQLGTRSNPQAC